MYDIRNLNIWKAEDNRRGALAASETRTICAGGKSAQIHLGAALAEVDIEDLFLSVRSFNCLKRAGCSKVGDVIELCGEEGEGLMRVRNLGNKSAREIVEKMEERQRAILEEERRDPPKVSKQSLQPPKSTWDTEIASLNLSRWARERLESCGIRTVRDLYATHPDKEPGWYAVREVFSRMA